MNNNTKAWIEFAKRDKAIFEELNIEIPKIHNISKLYKQIALKINIKFDEEALEEINSIYLETSYPASMGLLPSVWLILLIQK